MKKIKASIPELVDRATEVTENFALAILTTDLVPKSVTTILELSQGPVRLTGICKGSGMIHPNMATMLGYLATTTIGSAGGDETAWCAAFVNWVMLCAGEPGTNSAAARSWLAWGNHLALPQVGAITVLTRPGGNHVGMYVGGFDVGLKSFRS